MISNSYAADTQAEILNRRSTVEGPDLKRPRLFSDAEDTDVIDSESGPTNQEIVFDQLSFKPLYLISEWLEPSTMTKRLTVAVVLPSGIGSGAFSLTVVDSGDVLLLKVKWPKPLFNLRSMHWKWLRSDASDKIEEYHPKFIGFDNALKSLRAKQTDSIESLARIPLPFAVQAHIPAKYNLAWRHDSTRMLYVELKAYVEDYAIVQDQDTFEEL